MISQIRLLQRKHSAAVICACLTLAFAGMLASAAETSVIKLNDPYAGDEPDPISRYDLDAQMGNDLSQVTATASRLKTALIHKSKKLVGWEDMGPREGTTERKIKFPADRLTLRQALDLLTKEPNIRWEMSEEGVINIIPHESRLGIRISTCEVHDMALYGAAQHLFEQVAASHSEFRDALSALTQTRKKTFFHYDLGAPRINVRLSDSTLRTCLNELVRQDGSHDWILYYPSRNQNKSKFVIQFIPRNPGFKTAWNKAVDIENKQREKRLLLEGFRKTNGGAWVKPGPGGKWIDAPKEAEGNRSPGQ